MLTFFNPEHARHDAEFEIFRGQQVPAFERAERQERVAQRLRERGHELRVPHADAAAVLARLHAPRYLEFLAGAWSQWLALDPANAQRLPYASVWPVRSLRDDVEPDNFIARLGLYSMDNGQTVGPGTWQAGRAGADAAHSAALAVAGGVRAAFCLSRPPGHHAGPDFMGGYCFLNQAAVAAQTLRDAGAARVAVLDVDYHHGNGTQTLFYRRSDVYFASLHGDPRTEYPFFLGHADERGAGEGLGCNLNLPLPAGSAPEAWFHALEVALAQLAAWGADALVVSLGLDTAAEDPICRFGLTGDDFSRLGQRLAATGWPTVLVFEGGYANESLALNTVRVIEAFDTGARP
ncbi:MAG: histone deacetylase family protein [Rhodoferax sp.]|nr:histone deacetylase family protein [Rhodoferax sp.]